MPLTRASARPYPTGDLVSVLLPLPLDAAYDYRVGEGMCLAEGDFVSVPLGSRRATGVVWGPGSGEVAEERLKEVSGSLEAPPLPAESMRFVDWVAAYTLYPAGAVLKMAMSVPAALAAPKPVVAYVLGDDDAQLRMTAARRRVLDVLADGPARRLSELAREAATGTSVVKGLEGAGAIRAVTLPVRPKAEPDWRRPGPELSADQAAAARDLEAKARSGEFGVTLLDGVSGSGKTEVYFQAMNEALRCHCQVLVLLPEIALTAQWLDRFAKRFGAEPTLWHSDLTPARRRVAWRAVADGGARVMVGARSALFLPYPELGLIVVDEEHDPSFKQEDGVVYNARDMAVVRARLGDFPIVLASATPSLESTVNVSRGRYQARHLPERHGGAVLPRISLIDMRQDPPARGRWLSPALEGALKETLARGEQAMLFLNRRGYAPLTLCRGCGHRLQCPNCTAWLVEHRGRGGLLCHHCGHRAGLPKRCPSCQAEGKFAACGPGVERLAEEVESLLPGVRYAVAASDTISGPEAAQELVRRMEDHDIDLVIGTQIVAKGYHFPLLTLVGAIDADLGLAGGDLRAAERTFQLLTQVAGRAGRGRRPGRVLVQTFMPGHPVMEALASADRERFMEAEARARRDAAMPPFGKLVSLIVSGTDEAAVEDASRRLIRAAPEADGVRVLGPAPAPLALLRGRHRRRLLLKASREVAVQAHVRRWLNSVSLPGPVRVQVDVDPYSFL